MKRIILILVAFTTINAHSQTETLNWYIDGQTYATTTCESGGDVLLPTSPTKRGYTFMGWSLYTPIEYLESTGTQWIDTGYIPNLNTKIKLSVVSNNISSNAISGEAWNYRTTLLMFENATVKWHLCSNGSVTSSLISSNTVCNIEAENGVLILNNQIYSCYKLTSFSAYTNMRIFFNGNSSSKIKLYYFKIYDNNTLVRDFIPVLDKDGAPCMYDKVENKFYYNAGTGQFIAGPIIGAEQ